MQTKIDKKDIIIILIITLIYSILAFYKLGSLSNPQTFSDIPDNEVIIKIEEDKEIKDLIYFTGPERGEYLLASSLDGKKYNSFLEIGNNSVFTWSKKNINISASYIKITKLSSKGSIGEIAFLDSDDKLISVSSETKTLIDEQKNIPKEISYQNSTYFDEIYFSLSAYQYTKGIEVMEWTHPPLGKLIMAIPILIFGMTPFSYRLMGVIAGIIMLPVFYILAKKIFKERKWAILAILMMALDNFHLVESRLGTTDTFLVLFILLSSLFMYQYLELDGKTKLKTKIKYLFLSALFIACAISVKWSGLYAGLGLAILFFIDLFTHKKKQMTNKDLIKLIIITGLLFAILTLSIYTLSYILFPNLEGYDNSFKGFFNQIISMYNYHSNVTEPHPFSSPWYSWPFMIKPVWYYVDYYNGNMIRTITGIGNPLIWWSGATCVLFSYIKTFLKRDKNDIFLIILILSTIIPYAFINRPMFLYHYYPTLIFIMLTIVSVIKMLTEITKNNSIYIIFIILISICFILFLPVTIGLKIPKTYLHLIKWLNTWIF